MFVETKSITLLLILGKNALIWVESDVFISIITGKDINDIDNKDEINIINEGIIDDDNIVKQYFSGYIHVFIE